jgi:hypothetical protein
MRVLFIIAIIVSLVPASHRVHATSGTNLALNKTVSALPFAYGSLPSVVDGIYSYGADSTRWSSYGSGHATDYLDIDFGSAVPFNQVKLYLFNDGGGVKPPSSYNIQYWNGSIWVDAINQIKTPTIPAATINTGGPTAANTLNTVNFETVTSQKLKVIFTNPPGAYSGVVELEVFLDQSADELAASPVVTQIGLLPIQASVALSDKIAIAAARTAYNSLTVSQKNLVTNLSKLTDAEAAIVTLEAALIPGVRDVTILSAFSSSAGNTITLKLSSVLDNTYNIQAGNFEIIVNAVQVTVTDADYDMTDTNHQTIKLTLSSPVLLNQTLVTLSVQSGAFKTSNNELNNAIHSIPVITFKNLDLSQDNLIGVDDLVQMIGNPASQIDVNQDGIFNREDISMIMGRISMIH